MDLQKLQLIGENMGKIARELATTEEADKNIMRVFICVTLALGSCYGEGDKDFAGLRDRLQHLLEHHYGSAEEQETH